MLACAEFRRNAALCKGAADMAARGLYINGARPVRVFGVGDSVTTGTNLSSEGLDPRRRRLLFRCWHRGIREMDLVLGRFADAHLRSLTEGELDELERWLEVPDQQIFAWINGMEVTPPEFDTVFFRRLRSFHRKEKA
jgi:antitoxin CptB